MDWVFNPIKYSCSQEYIDPKGQTKRNTFHRFDPPKYDSNDRDAFTFYSEGSLDEMYWTILYRSRFSPGISRKKNGF